MFIEIYTWGINVCHFLSGIKSNTPSLYYHCHTLANIINSGCSNHFST